MRRPVLFSLALLFALSLQFCSALEPVEHYGSVPKGFTLEGVARGIDSIKNIRFDKANNRFLINDTDIYQSPVELKELQEIYKSLLQDDRLGVSLGDLDAVICYGKLSKRGAVARNLIKADKLVGGIVFAEMRWIQGIRLINNYRPVRATPRTIRSAIYSNVTDFTFRKLTPMKNPGGPAQFVRTGYNLSLTLIPISNRRAPDGGYLPDNDRRARNEVQPEDRRNLNHVEANRKAYERYPSIQKAIAYGEAAAFLRFLRDSGVNMQQLYTHLK